MVDEAQTMFAGLSYHGHSGATRPCESAVLEALQREPLIERARILSCDRHHGLLLIGAFDDCLIIKPGFSSGYCGEGPSGLSRSLAMLSEHGVQIDEVDLSADLFDRLEASALTHADLDFVRTARAVRIGQYQDYIDQHDWVLAREGHLWSRYSARLPLAIMAPGLVDLVREFDQRPDYVLLKAYTRLEDRLRETTGETCSGVKLVDSAFGQKSPKLVLPDREDRGEQAGLAFLFRGAFQLHRNPHAHSEIDRSPDDAASEFLLVNHLFRLLETLEPGPQYIAEKENSVTGEDGDC